MRIRWKLLVLLLAIALLPLAFVAGTMNRATRSLGEKIGRQARDVLTRRAEHELRMLVAGQADALGRQGKIIELVLQLQARAVQEGLARPASPDRKTYFLEDFRKPENLPFKLTTSPRYFRLDERWEKQFDPISLEEQAFGTAPGVSREAVMDDARRLADLAPTYRSLYDKYSDLVFWQYTALEDGLYSTYPGHGRYPSDYDPRRREWYQRAKAESDLIWIPPYIDAATGRTVMTAAMPILGPDGRFIGATALDMVVKELIETTRLPVFGSPAACLVALVPRHEAELPTRLRDLNVKDHRPDELGLLVFIQPSNAKALSPQAGGPRVWLESSDRLVFLDMVRDMQAGRSGVRQMSYKGQPSIWAYGPVWGNATFMVVVAAYDDVVAEAEEAEQTILGMTYDQLKIRAAIALSAVLVVTLIAFVGSRTVTRPIRRLTEAAARITRGDLDAQVDVRTRDEIGELGRRFNEMVPALRDRMRLRQSLSLAMEVQQHLLPSAPPCVPGLEVAGTSIYCDETGGVYFDFLDLSEIAPGELGIAVGDVSGHGIAAALLMATARAVLRSSVDRPGTLADLMRKMNRHLTHDTPRGRFMTLFYLVADGRRHSIRWANAGHDPAIFYDPATDTFEELQDGGLPLGVIADGEYEESRRDDLKAGQVLVIGTDGIWEMTNAERKMFGKDALREIIRRRAADSAADIMKAVTDALADFRKGSAQQDDVTLVVVKITPSAA